mmetsp:Transcript_27138/g.64339  ORF Transcript_27138/g.64339 Transcript_27138/m.64339 type:complete len:137 (+) Transcript_27138:1035-1445(+)
MLPKLAFRSPPTVWFVYMAICSVANPRRSASGQRPISEKAKVQLAPHPDALDSIASGMKTSSRLRRVESNISCAVGTKGAVQFGPAGPTRGFGAGGSLQGPLTLRLRFAYDCHKLPSKTPRPEPLDVPLGFRAAAA